MKRTFGTTLLACGALACCISSCVKADGTSASEAASAFAGPAPGTEVVLMSKDDGDLHIERRVSASDTARPGSLAIVERYVNHDTGEQLKETSYFLDSSASELIRRSSSGEKILLIRLQPDFANSSWPGTMRLSTGEDPSSDSFGPKLGGDCRILDLTKKKVVNSVLKALRVQCQHHAANGETVIRTTEYAEGLGLIGLVVDIQGQGGERRGHYEWQLLGVNPKPSN
jgi:hypothetical protein